MTTSEQIVALKDGRVDVAFGRLHIEDSMLSQKVIRIQAIIVALPRNHALAIRHKPIRLREIAAEPVILDRRAPKPNYGDLILGYYRERGLAPAKVIEVRDLQTALGLVASEAGVALVPASARRFGREDVSFCDLDEANMIAPVIMCQRARERSSELALLRKLIREFDKWSPSREV
jgi:DNA-binding transcriptional LysR family regulator